jgi:hypothetical protein
MRSIKRITLLTLLCMSPTFTLENTAYSKQGVLNLAQPIDEKGNIQHIAQTNPSNACSEAVRAGRNRIESIKNIQSVNVKQYDIDLSYPDHPIGRSQRYIYSMKGTAVDSVMGSPKLMSSIAESIIKNCDTIGSITFALANSGWGISVGILSDGRIGVFKCLNHPDPRLGIRRKISWGEEYCSL